jgi:hypothetical protein
MKRAVSLWFVGRWDFILPIFFNTDKQTLEVQRSNHLSYFGLNLSNYYPPDGNDNRIMFIV